MLIGVISDTHDNIGSVERAVKVFNEWGVSLVVHCGDWCAPFTLVKFKDLRCKLVGVFGNVDGERELLRRRARELKFEVEGEFLHLVLNGRSIAVYHGVYEDIVRALAKCGEYDIVLRGHTHRAEVQKLGNCIVVNPGEACGYLTGRRTVAIVNLETLDVRIIEL
ncbi:MAG: hypothetical protein DRJ40_08765 [Thermoprotei archaeon]|nr:MAG: hypothetical protein DRJ40_08765 [Thermoprotei archaeon]